MHGNEPHAQLWSAPNTHGQCLLLCIFLHEHKRTQIQIKCGSTTGNCGLSVEQCTQQSKPTRKDDDHKDDGNFEEKSLVRNDYKINTTLLGQRDRQVVNRRKAGWRMEGEPNVSWTPAKEKRRYIRDQFPRLDSVFNTYPIRKDMF